MQQGYEIADIEHMLRDSPESLSRDQLFTLIAHLQKQERSLNQQVKTWKEQTAMRDVEIRNRGKKIKSLKRKLRKPRRKAATGVMCTFEPIAPTKPCVNCGATGHFWHNMGTEFEWINRYESRTRHFNSRTCTKCSYMEKTYR